MLGAFGQTPLQSLCAQSATRKALKDQGRSLDNPQTLSENGGFSKHRHPPHDQISFLWSICPDWFVSGFYDKILL